MLRYVERLGMLLAIGALLTAATGRSVAQVYLPPAPVVTSYYTPPVVSYYPATPVVYYPAPTVSYYAAPTVTYYAAPAVVSYPTTVTTYRYGLLPRRQVTVTTYGTPAVGYYRSGYYYYP
jgi:hypothetical protein